MFKRNFVLCKNHESEMFKLNLDILPVFHTDKNHQRSYFEGPYVVKASGDIVGEGKLFVSTKKTLRAN